MESKEYSMLQILLARDSSNPLASAQFAGSSRSQSFACLVPDILS